MVTQNPYREGRCLIWDATVVDTLATSYVRSTAQKVGAAASIAERRKLSTYSAFAKDFEVMPLAFETFGPTSDNTMAFLNDLKRKINEVQGDRRSGHHFLQRLSLSIQRGNAISVLGTLE